MKDLLESIHDRLYDSFNGFKRNPAFLGCLCATFYHKINKTKKPFSLLDDKKIVVAEIKHERGLAKPEASRPASETKVQGRKEYERQKMTH